MPSSYTPSLRLTLPANDELAGTWGTTVNTGVTSLAEAAIAGTAAVAMTDADYTLSIANGATDQSRNMFITLTGTLTATRNVICPSVSKLYFVTNNTTGGYAITFKTLAGAGISVPNGQRAIIYCNGTDALNGFTNFPFSSITLSGSLTLSGGTANGITYLNGSKVVTSGTALTFDGTNFAVTGTASATKLIPTGGTAAGNGMYLPSANTVAISTNGVDALTVGATGNTTIAGTASATKLIPTGGTAAGNGMYLPSANTIAISTNGADALTISSTGATTVSSLTINNGYTEGVFAVSGTTPALSPTNGSIQTWTLSGASTPTAGTWASGQSLTLMVDDGTAYTINWASVAVTWKTNLGTAPTLNTTGFTVIQLWKVGTTIYGARVGDA